MKWLLLALFLVGSGLLTIGMLVNRSADMDTRNSGIAPAVELSVAALSLDVVLAIGFGIYKAFAS